MRLKEWLGLIFLILFAWWTLTNAKAEDNCQGGAISASCCCTNGCCKSVSPTRLIAQPDDQWLIVASGQVIKRTGWSPDGTIILCQCDLIGGKWTVHDRALARCLYMPMPNS